MVTALLVAGAWLLRNRLGVGFDPGSFRGAVEDLGLWGPAVFVALVTFRVLLGLPSQVLLIGAGLAFGTAEGALYGALGLTLSGVLYFVGARWAGRDWLESRVPARMRPAFDAAGTRVGSAFLAVGTGYPFGPITAYHTLAGLTGMALPAFVAAVGVGSLVRAVTYTFFGSRLVEGNAEALALGAAALAAAFVLPLCFPRSRRVVQQMLAGARPVRPPGAARSGPTPPGTSRSGPD